MNTRKYLLIFAFIICTIFLSSCIPLDPITLHGDIKGSVTDAETSEPIQGATVELIQSDVTTDTTSSGNDGTYLLKNIIPGDYDIQASKFTYGTSLKDVKVEQAKTREIDFTLPGVPIPNISVTYLDFGLDLTSLTFAISNVGKRKLSYIINTSQDWLTVNPFSGDITSEIDTITVTINKTGLSDSVIYKEKIEITSTGGTAPLQDTIGIYLNGVLDIRNLRYYKIVRIGTQTWMAENLNAGKESSVLFFGINNGIIEKTCFRDQSINCQIYCGLYEWNEAMQFNPSDSGIIGTTQGICPTGWHMPTEKEWGTLIDYLGNKQVAGGKLKETGTLHWKSPNIRATNETGFTALPGGFGECTDSLYNWDKMNSAGFFWTATTPSGYGPTIFDADFGSHLELVYNSGLVAILYYPDRYLTCSVRCIKDPF